MAALGIALLLVHAAGAQQVRSDPSGVARAVDSLAHFLSHTHRINDNAVVMSAAFTGAIPEARWPALIAVAGPQATNDLIYSNFGYNVAAMVIDRLRPRGWKRYLEEDVFRPAGMRDTYARVSALAQKQILRFAQDDMLGLVICEFQTRR